MTKSDFLFEASVRLVYGAPVLMGAGVVLLLQNLPVQESLAEATNWVIAVNLFFGTFYWGHLKWEREKERIDTKVENDFALFMEAVKDVAEEENWSKKYPKELPPGDEPRGG